MIINKPVYLTGYGSYKCFLVNVRKPKFVKTPSEKYSLQLSRKLIIMNFGGTVHLNKVGLGIILIIFVLTFLYITRRFDFDNDNADKGPSELNIRQILLTAIELAEKGGQEVVKVRKERNLKIGSKGLTKEGANDPVTEADYKSHCVMYFGFKKLYPTLQIVSEEDKTEEECRGLIPTLSLQPGPVLGLDMLVNEDLPTKDLTVWIDPLDATQEFTENLLEYVTTLVCVAYKGRPIVGVVHKPFAKDHRTTWAWLNKGVSPDLQALIKKVQPEPVIVVSRSHGGDVEKSMKDVFGQNTKVILAGGAGYKIMQVVNGNVTAYVHTKYIKKWDVCAGDAILTAVGGHLTTLNNEDLDYSYNAEHGNMLGILATLYNHDWYASKLSGMKDSI